MNPEKLRILWEREERAAHIHGWDFSHIRGKYEEEHDLPWSYEQVVRHWLDSSLALMDYDTGAANSCCRCAIHTKKHPPRRDTRPM